MHFCETDLVRNLQLGRKSPVNRNAHGKRRNVKLQRLSRNPENRSRVS